MHYAVIVSPGSIDAGPIPFDLYATDHSNRIILFCRAGFKITPRHEQVLRSSDRIFYISSKDQDNYFDYAFDRIDKIVGNPGIHNNEKVKILLGVGRRAARRLLEDPRSKEVVSGAERFVESHVELLVQASHLASEMFATTPPDTYTLAHTINVCTFCLLMGRLLLGQSERELKQLGMAGLMHDVGKTMVKSSILYKPGPLTSEEMAQVRKYPLYSLEIASSHGLPRPVLRAVRSHQERIDGSGYPDGLAGDDIEPDARVIALADVYDALTSDRVYRKQLSHIQALVEIAGQAHRFDSLALRALLQIVLRDKRLIARFYKKYLVAPHSKPEQDDKGDKKKDKRGLRLIHGGK